MTILWRGLRVTFGFFLILGLIFASAVFSVLLYAKFTGKENVLLGQSAAMSLTSAKTIAPVEVSIEPPAPTPEPEPVLSAMIDAPIINQRPELPAGCEVASLTMLVQYYGIDKGKMELAEEMPKDETPYALNKDGSIRYWGHPSTGFVGDVTRKGRGFGIYHDGLMPLLEHYIPTAIDMTDQPFEYYEQQIANDIPVVVWTTIDYKVPSRWVTWDTPIGPIKTTYMEHAVLMVGYDESYVYFNDPNYGKKNVKLEKARFIEIWEQMGKQGLSYTK